MWFMKWQNPGIAFGSRSGDETGTTTSTFTSTFPELEGVEYKTQEELDAAEASATEMRNSITGIQDTINTTVDDPQAAYDAAYADLTRYNTELQQLAALDQDDPVVKYRTSELTDLISGSRDILNQSSAILSSSLLEGQRELVVGASNDPTDILNKAEVAQVDGTAPGTLVDETAHQVDPSGVAAKVEQAQAETMAVPEAQDATQAGVTTVADEVAAAVEDIDPVTGKLSKEATVRGQLELLMEDFEGGQTPPWASGAMRQAMGIMQQRGLGASSIAGQAVVQAAMEAALPIAMEDANLIAGMEMQNLAHEQQVAIFKTQQRVAGLLSDQAALNAAEQFNASSDNQVKMFFADLEANAARFNAEQINGIRQFNAGEANAVELFNANIRNQRDQFNASQSLIISQANAKWRQLVSTTNTAAQNEANMIEARTANAITAAQLEQIWQRERDLLDYAFRSSESSLDRSTQLLLQKMTADAALDIAEFEEKMNNSASFGTFMAKAAQLLLGIL